MKILYVGTLDPFGTCYSRFSSLRELEPDIHGFDTDRELPWMSLGRIHRSFEFHFRVGPCLRRANQALIATCDRLRPDLVWVDTGSWIWPSTLRALRRQGCFLVHHITDALEARYWRVHLQRRLLRETISCYDVFFTTNLDDQKKLSLSEKPIALLTDLGYDHRRFDPSPLSPELATQWDNPLIFIGHYEKNTEAGILALIDADLPVKVFGHPPPGLLCPIARSSEIGCSRNLATKTMPVPSKEPGSVCASSPFSITTRPLRGVSRFPGLGLSSWRSARLSTSNAWFAERLVSLSAEWQRRIARTTGSGQLSLFS